MNKKKFILLGFAVVFAAVMAFNVGMASNNNSLTDITLANVEALAGTECIVTCPSGAKIVCDTSPCAAGDDWVMCGGKITAC